MSKSGVLEIVDPNLYSYTYSSSIGQGSIRATVAGMLICFLAPTESGEDVDGPPPSPKMSKKDGGGILDLKAYEEDTIKAGYVLSQDGRKWCRLWYQVKQDFCLYKFRAHEVRGRA